jgi:hypothetical protein
MGSDVAVYAGKLEGEKIVWTREAAASADTFSEWVENGRYFIEGKSAGEGTSDFSGEYVLARTEAD